MMTELQVGPATDAAIASFIGLGMPGVDPSRAKRTDETSHWGIAVVAGTGEREWYYRGPRYSEDMGHAWRVVEALADPYEVRLEMCAEGWLLTVDNGDRQWYGQAETAPLAICEAALAVSGHCHE